MLVNIKSNGDKFFYLPACSRQEDHLGTIRVVLDSTNNIIAANDYDAWGYPLENRSFTSGSVDKKYQFTGKERDKESGLGNNDGYDYFGLRYYDNRIGRWGQADPLLSLNLTTSPYCYTSNRPLIFKDYKGLDDYYYLRGRTIPIIYRSPEENRYFYEHSEGNWEITEATGDYSFMLGRTFFMANSKMTAIFYRDAKKGAEYESSDVKTNFGSSTAPQLVSMATMGTDWIKNWQLLKRLFIAKNSIDGGSFDYKTVYDKILRPDKLFLFNGLVYNQQEAGNILWGMTVAHYDISLLEANLGANAFKFAKSMMTEWLKYEFDEPNEVMAFTKGYEYYISNPF